MIEEQVKLPLRVAAGVVSQGIRIRFGRSAVTIMGVVLGIAFLMSILTGLVIKKGVEAEDRMRAEANRMYNFLVAEMGPPAGRTIGVILTGRLSKTETLLLQRLQQGGLEAFNCVSASGAPSDGLEGLKRKTVQLENAGKDASLILAAGDGPLPAAPWDRILSDARQQIIALARKSFSVTPPKGAAITVLERDLHDDEIGKMKADARRSRFRNTWIIIVSLLVTVIGISNAMLMSVTERFQEIGTMKCLGALSAFIRRVFLIESGFMGVVGGVLGAAAGCAFSIAVYGAAYGFGPVLGSLEAGRLALYFALSVLAAIGLSMIAAIYPASLASKMRPADALRSNI